MTVLRLSNVYKSFGAEPILTNINIHIRAGEKVGLVGRNGSGKSTLLKIIAGHLTANSGEIHMPNEVELGYLAQQTNLQSTRSIWDEMMTVFKPLQKMEVRLREMEQQMADPHILADERKYNELLQAYDRKQLTFKNEGGYEYEAEIRTVLAGMQFGSFDYNMKVCELSGGQKTRLALAKLLLAKPDLLILDEPTNHLDIETLTWLEHYLTAYKGAIVIVSHDRYFLDKIITNVVELAHTKATTYNGNYSHYLIERAKRYESELKKFEKQQKKIATYENFIQRNIARASTTRRARSRRRQLERMTVIDEPTRLEKSASFSFTTKRQSGNDVLRINDLTVSYNTNTILKKLHLSIDRGEAVALIGPNGSGKSTLLKAIVKEIPVDEGVIRFGSHVTVGYYDQEQANLTSNKLVLNEIWDEFPTIPERDIRTVLGNFLFSGDDVLQPVSTLSGGEKARLALAKLMLKEANLLILDEPTNHLDLDAKEVLEEALIDYPGTILFVSHDRYFLNRIATRVDELENGSLTTYLGDYDYYIQKKDEQKKRKELTKKQHNQKHAQTKQTDKSTYELNRAQRQKDRRRQRRITEIEKTIETIEQTIAEHEETLCKPAVYSDYEKALSIQQKIDKGNKQIDKLLTEWEQLHLKDVTN